MLSTALISRWTDADNEDGNNATTTSTKIATKTTKDNYRENHKDNHKIYRMDNQLKFIFVCYFFLDICVNGGYIHTHLEDEWSHVWRMCC